MNPTSFSITDLVEDNNSGSDSDTNFDAAPEYYQPIPAVVDDDSSQGNSVEEHHAYSMDEAENGISSINLNGDIGQKSSSDDDDEEEEEEEEEEERTRQASDSAILRAFREDENRRNAPLTAENATRVMQAMRRISFGGSAPDWVAQVPEDQWIAHLRSSGRPPNLPTPY